MINNRQQGRRRGRGGQRPGGGGAPGNPNSGNRIDNRARGNANQLWEKYKNLAADAQRQGDRVTTEYYHQFADHYYRVLAESRPRFEEQQRERRAREDQFDDEAEAADQDDFGEEGEAIRPGEQMGASQQGGGERRRFEERRPRRDEDERRPRRDRERAERLNDQPRAQAQPALEPQAEAAEPDLPLPELEAEPPQPARRRGRPRKEAAEQPAGFDADRLPPALGAPANDEGEGAEPKPRRRRARTADTEASAAE